MRQDDYKKKIIEYLEKNIQKGYTIESLRWALVGQGYSRTAVESAINDLNKQLAKKAPVLHEEPIIRHEIIGEDDEPIAVQKSWWRRFFGL